MGRLSGGWGSGRTSALCPSVRVTHVPFLSQGEDVLPPGAAGSRPACKCALSAAWDTECSGGARGQGPASWLPAGQGAASEPRGRRAVCCHRELGILVAKTPQHVPGGWTLRSTHVQAGALGFPRLNTPLVWASEVLRAKPSHMSSCMLSPPPAVSLLPRSVDGVGVCGMGPAVNFSIGLPRYDRRVAGPRILP